MNVSFTSLNLKHFIKVQLEEGATPPQKSHPDDAGWDLVALDDGDVIFGHDGSVYLIKYNTGVKCDPLGACLLLFPRSSVCKTDLVMGNSVGLIDPGYRGNIIAAFRPIRNQNNPEIMKKYKKGDRIAQLVPMMPMAAEFVCDSISQSGRGSGGFGSTGS